MHTLRRVAFTLGALLCAEAAVCGSVTVNIKSAGSVSPEDTVIVFDPLDVSVAPAHVSATIDQVDKEFVPKVSIIRTGTSVTFVNSDHVRHQVYSFSLPKTFTLKLYAGSPETPVVFDKPGLVVLGCNIHDNMLAFVAVVDSPYFAKASASGLVDLKLPQGHYRLRVWHPRLAAAEPAREIVVASTPVTISLVLDLTADTPGGTPWIE